MHESRTPKKKYCLERNKKRVEQNTNYPFDSTKYIDMLQHNKIKIKNYFVLKNNFSAVLVDCRFSFGSLDEFLFFSVCAFLFSFVVVVDVVDVVCCTFRRCEAFVDFTAFYLLFESNVKTVAHPVVSFPHTNTYARCVCARTMAKQTMS